MTALLNQLRYRRCPNCGSTTVRTSETNPYLDRLSKRLFLKLSFRRPYRCLDCDERFYDLRFKRRLEPSQAA